MKNGFARLVSIVGHPALVMPLAAAVASNHNNNSLFIWIAPLLAALCALIIMAYSFFKTKTGSWVHIDASAKQERSELNIFSILMLAAVTAGLASAKVDNAIVLVVGISAVLILVAHLLRKIMKPSMHVAFAVLAIGIVWPMYWMALILALLSGVLVWSRLALLRHTGIDLGAGMLLGAIAGVVFQMLLV